jgi:F-type H+-transporting ATPase subunit epsilon
MNTFRLIIASPDGNLFDGQAYMLTARGSEGELAVLAGHVPFVTTVVPCQVKIELPDEEADDRIGHTDGGLLSVSHDTVTLLSSSFRWAENKE